VRTELLVPGGVILDSRDGPVFPGIGPIHGGHELRLTKALKSLIEDLKVGKRIQLPASSSLIFFHPPDVNPELNHPRSAHEHAILNDKPLVRLEYHRNMVFIPCLDDRRDKTDTNPR
jgi:hypothetical protein